ncbi:putative GNAT family acetyltransferase [Xylariales sp. PMI_506]|nr:putative GNAT family acetyltransferase [Xylariales sp. PMI_506]
MVFSLPINTTRLENERLRLVPAESDLTSFAANYVENVKDHPELYSYLPYGPFTTAEEYERWYNGRIAPNSTETIFAIYLKAGMVQQRGLGGGGSEFSVEDDTLAGTIGLCGTAPDHSTTEIGHILLFPCFQRTFVGTNANALLLRHLLDPLPYDLNLRRVQWQANLDNEASINAAKRLGFTLEGVIRWQRVLPVTKTGLEPQGIPRKGADDRELGPGRHTAMLSLCWDDWEGGKREGVIQLLKR